MGDLLEVGPKNAQAYAKLMVWSIVAGYYEDIVHRILGSLKGKLSSEGESEGEEAPEKNPPGASRP